MKLLLVFILIFHYVSCFSQDDIYYKSESKSIYSTKPAKNSNVIIVTIPDSAQKALKDLGFLLQDKGYSLEKYDKEFLSITTDYKTYKFAGSATMKIIAVAKKEGSKSILKIRSKIEIVSILAGSPIAEDACFCGFGGDARRNAFNELNNIASLLKSEKIEYKFE